LIIENKLQWIANSSAKCFIAESKDYIYAIPNGNLPMNINGSMIKSLIKQYKLQPSQICAVVILYYIFSNTV